MVNPRKLEHNHRFRMISAGIPHALPSGHEDNDVPIFWLLLCVDSERVGSLLEASHLAGPLQP